MRKPRLFIASSGAAEPLVKLLWVHLTLANIDVVMWRDVGAASTMFLDQLVQECKICDFAVVLLTRDDILIKKQVKYQGPRDNCIYEAGLFTGALGSDYRRCFLLTSV